MLPIVLPRNATIRGAPPAARGGSPSSCSKSDTTARTSSPGYSPSRACAAATSAGSLTSTGTYVRRVPAERSASISSRVFSEYPDPSSTRVPAPLSAAISPAVQCRISRSARVG